MKKDLLNLLNNIQEHGEETPTFDLMYNEGISESGE